MLYSKEVLGAIAELQQKNPYLLLCGSAALIMRNMLENRNMSDIDFVINDANFPFIPGVNFFPDPYSELNESDRYRSYSGFYKYQKHAFKINVLSFEDQIELYDEDFQGIRCQRLQDIINWKEKYNRPKDIKDLQKITIKAIEEALYKET